MLTIYDTTGHSLLKHNETAPMTKDTVWYDLLDPTPEEDALRREVSRHLGADARRDARDRGLEPLLSGEAARAT